MQKIILSLFLLLIYPFTVIHHRNHQNITETGLFLPDDLQATLWAESPMLYNPTNMDVDVKGRIWVTEAVNYRKFNIKDSGYMHHNQGDRVVILEDTNNDGRADVSKVFVQDPDLISPVGIAVLGSKVIVSCSPKLLVFTDENGDDVADKKEILLEGFGGKDHDHSLHAVYAGADGNWYFNTGNAGPHTVTDKGGFTLRSGSLYTGGSPYNLENEGNRVSDDGKTWVGGLALRMNADGKNLRVMAHNFRNSYEVFPDSYGNLWQNDNDDEVMACRTTWLMEGGNAGFFSADGTRTWKADQRPGQSIFTAHWHQEDPGVIPAGYQTGAGAPTGVSFIEGDELREHYRGTLLSADAGRNIIFSFRPAINKSGYEFNKHKNFISSVPDGNENYVWNDSTHVRNQEKWFRPSDVTIGTDGALYVSDWYDPVVGGHQMIDKQGYGRIYRITGKGKAMPKPSIDLNTIEGQIQALKNSAINVRYEGFTRLVEGGEKNVPHLVPLLKDSNPYIQARALWLISKLGAVGISETGKQLDNNNPIIRAVAYRALRQVVDDIVPHAKKLVRDTSAFVRREVILSLQNVPLSDSRELMADLMKNFDARDKWYVEALGAVMESDADEWYKLAKASLARNTSPLQWNDKMEAIAWRLHPASAVDDLAMRASSPVLKPTQRKKSITALAFINTKEAAAKMVELSKSSSQDVSAAAAYWLNFRKTNQWASLLDWEKVKINTAQKRSTPVQPDKVNKQVSNSKEYTISSIVAVKGDAKAGKKVFDTKCGMCHVVNGAGSNLGPDLSAITSKFGDSELLRAIIYPDEAILFGYEPWQVQTKDGKGMMGFLISDTKQTMVLRDLAGNDHVVKKEVIRSAKKQNKSLMPSAAQNGMSEKDLRDVLAFLKSARVN